MTAPAHSPHHQAVLAACRALDAGDRPLTELAEQAGLSPTQFRRVFRAVVGLTPKQYAQARRAERLVSGLEDADSVSDAVYEAGFASTGRFYEATDRRLGMAPSTWRNRGAGQTLRTAVGPCSLGTVIVATTDRGICSILLADHESEARALLAERFARATLEPSPHLAQTLAAVVRLIDDPSSGHDLPLDVRGTAFQELVWRALRAIPPGQTRTYAELARAVGKERAARAVAAACAANPLAIAIPCHRVIRGDGSLAGYRWGVDRKRALLDREAR